MSVKRNVIANYLGHGWKALMGVAFIPLYIKYLGIEAYGLIGIFSILQAWLALLDMGMKPTLGREMARFTGGAHDIQTIRDLLRSVEMAGVLIAAVVAIGIWSASGWLASDWVKAENLRMEAVASAFAVMGAVTALRFLEDIYVSTIIGLQRQVLENAMAASLATIRGLGAIGVLAWVSPSIEAFFLWQLLMSIATVLLFAGVAYRVLPTSSRPARFSRPALAGIWHFASGMTAITFLVLLLTQLDKILLSRLLSLEAFGYYALAGVVVNALYMLIAPISTAFYPRFTELVTRGDEGTLRTIFHQSAQMITVVLGSAAIVMMMFGERLLFIWTADSHLSGKVGPILSVLAAGTLINGLMLIPYQMQLAYGWTGFAIRLNIVAVAVLVPAILWIVPRYGSLGAAWVWVILNAGYLVIGMHFMYRRLMRTEKWRWYRNDLLVPLGAAAAVAMACRAAMPGEMGRVAELSALTLISVCVLIASALAAPAVRHQLILHMPGGAVR